MHATAAVVHLQAYINHAWCRDLQIRISKEQDLFQGLARLHCDTFNTEPVLLLSQDCNAAGILISSQQEQQLVTALQVRYGLARLGKTCFGLAGKRCFPGGLLPS